MLPFIPLPSTHASQPRPALTWDIFCQVIDNFGDIGVCWRAAADLASRGQRVRLWMDDAGALAWMAPLPHPEGLSVHGWPVQAADVPPVVGDVVIEAFGCEIPPPFLAAIARRAPLWINLEYLSAEGYVERCHGLPSPLMSGPAAGLTRWFFYPGFTAATGGLLRESDLAARQQTFAGEGRNAWRARHAIAPGDCAISLFCYEPAALPEWLAALHAQPPLPGATHLLVTPGRAADAVRQAMGAMAATGHGAVRHHALAPCPQRQFDDMLWACDLNLVRGEDSLVRALWAGQPLVWHIYPQHDDAHHDKLDAFLDWLRAPPSLRAFHHAWNGMAPASTLPALTPALLGQWQQCIQAARAQLLRQPPLIDQLQAFAAEKS
ncbi:Uncharacterized protein conserved in bacteria [Delftia tsuruhatensis]|uniref:elongation factor P maturation arginine rhamnosyltransferase EarP n=1 Tax=Delftia tsuruhatensis TaxID=180282 RepID=UPI001E6E8F96|nr:elongation factor P maturation arginine rhamnosyltransferase EarP [Delftia tsuruhatensis]CAB5694613.1 Uncharacterized protein conserved in bacteria [Delftia tsuruhatensis]CAC9687139.1 Uncharacterized protein conserved in bacteria [Delftia tsuruhatensis]